MVFSRHLVGRLPASIFAFYGLYFLFAKKSQQKIVTLVQAVKYQRTWWNVCVRFSQNKHNGCTFWFLRFIMKVPLTVQKSGKCNSKTIQQTKKLSINTFMEKSNKPIDLEISVLEGRDITDFFSYFGNLGYQDSAAKIKILQSYVQWPCSRLEVLLESLVVDFKPAVVEIHELKTWF